MTEKPQVDFEEVVKASGMPVTKEALRERFNGIVQDEGLITNTSNMSPFWRLITAIVTTPVLWLKDVLVGTVLANMFVATASGQMLRLLAWAVNVTAKPATAAQGVIRFYKADAGAVVTVKAGTLIQTERINGTVYELATTADFTLAAGVASALIPVQATATGGAFNLAPGYYRILPVAVDGISHAVNETDWLTVPGADEESDDELRERCRNQFNLVGNYHTDAVYRSMIASVAGLSIDRIFFEHEAPRGPGTANAYLLLDTGVTSDPFIEAVNDYITTQGHHGHGDDMQCFAMPETRHTLAVTLYVRNLANLTDEEQSALRAGAENLIRCAFRENNEFDVKKTWPFSRFSFSNLGRELHRQFAAIDSLAFSLTDIVSGLSVPRLDTLTVRLMNA
ncbi:baseplate J/gp47 family protein [Cronobacter sakazakii]|uniref:baseplate J/gp47 family protein n=1 Tax=Cronobacter sakazakii TaxID=28141 RepID=UPI00277BF6D4|nr:baseplate J/gp47 family protein [Cronobacter sakazakii]EIX1500281.1 baseplate J/gp47 family protein [Cronobacter sakazakii]EIX6180093.1 baseplate J/gp47 family protein [Cronobacter sakazakii]EIX6196404.1 baseplate J/gp47 family protein [Cronobacter sakazakii]EIX6203128.1 baseplate J/gp47 family protein [Cronobacter sakazakii]EIX6247001.1 baseplate J/gp47 family protein [Cronobacter sakazakii]